MPAVGYAGETLASLSLLRPWLQLVKAPLCLGVALSTAFGAVLHTPLVTSSLTLSVSGIFLVACGAAGLNSVQEKELDRQLRRTCRRPVVTGRIAANKAIAVSLGLILPGLALLLLSKGSRVPTLLALAALGLYNGCYTPLKQTTPYALLPGGLAGALPPLIGWTAAGGALTDPSALALLSLFFLWQIPHFCLLLLAHQQEYRNIPQPTLIRLLPEASLKRITLAWTLACVVAALALALDHQLEPAARLIIALMGFALLFALLPLIDRRTPPKYRHLFLRFNAALFTALLAAATVQLMAWP